MSYCQPIINKLLQGINADLQMFFDKSSSYFFIAFFSFHAFGYHGLITYKEQCTGGDLIIEANCENSSGFHVNCIALISWRYSLKSSSCSHTLRFVVYTVPVQ